jgi:predicted TIM-barrel fold metal-dependent hydrolase
MKDGMFIFDQVIHMFDNTKENVVDPAIANSIFGFSQVFAMPPFMPAIDAKSWWAQNSVEDAARMLFEESDTDMAMAQTVPLLGGAWRRGFAPADRQYALAKAYPNRVLFCGGVDPIAQGIDGALWELERQIVEWGAKSIKFYQVQGKNLHWRADDPQLAYPLYDKCLELGVKVVQFHKGFPFGPQRMELLMPNDLQDAARDYPELIFINHHLGDPYVNETINISARYPNIWVALSGFINIYPIQPEVALHNLGRLLIMVGPDRLMYGSEAFAFPRVQGAIDLFMEMEMPEYLQDRYGYPPLTAEIKRKIVGENMARLFGIDIPAKKKELYGDPNASLVSTKKTPDVPVPDLSGPKAVKLAHVAAMSETVPR